MWQFCHFLFHPIGWFFWGSAGIGDNLGDGIITNFGDNLCDDFATICFTQYGDFFVDLPEMVRINFISLRQPTKRGKLFKYLVQFLVWESQSSRSSTQKLWGCGGPNMSRAQKWNLTQKRESQMRTPQFWEWTNGQQNRLKRKLLQCPHCIKTFTEEDRLNGHIEVDHYMEWRTVRVYLCFLFLTIIGAINGCGQSVQYLHRLKIKVAQMEEWTQILLYFGKDLVRLLEEAGNQETCQQGLLASMLRPLNLDWVFLEIQVVIFLVLVSNISLKWICICISNITFW